MRNLPASHKPSRSAGSFIFHRDTACVQVQDGAVLAVVQAEDGRSAGVRRRRRRPGFHPRDCSQDLLAIFTRNARDFRETGIDVIDPWEEG